MYYFSSDLYWAVHLQYHNYCTHKDFVILSPEFTFASVVITAAATGDLTAKHNCG